MLWFALFGTLTIQVILVRWVCVWLVPMHWKRIVFWAWLFGFVCAAVVTINVPVRVPEFGESQFRSVLATYIGFGRFVLVSTIIATLVAMLERLTSQRMLGTFSFWRRRT